MTVTVSMTTHFTKQVDDAESVAASVAKTNRGMRGMLKKYGRRQRDAERGAPQPKLEGNAAAEAGKGADAEAVARAVLEALNAHDPL